MAPTTETIVPLTFSEILLMIREFYFDQCRTKNRKVSMINGESGWNYCISIRREQASAGKNSSLPFSLILPSPLQERGKASALYFESLPVNSAETSLTPGLPSNWMIFRPAPGALAFSLK